MYLVDTSVWVDHLKRRSSSLIPFLVEGRVVTHEFVIGELSLGQFSSGKDEFFERFLAIERVETSTHEEVISFSRQHSLSGKGIGWIDCHILCAASKNKAKLLTADKSLQKLARIIL